MSTITATAGFFQGNSTTPLTAQDLDTAVAAAAATVNGALVSANAAAASAATAASNATAAASSAATAASAAASAAPAVTAASNASTYASNAAASATAAAASATTAGTNATNAATSATAAASSATAASTSASTASSQATLATTQAGKAASSAGAASGSATAAANSATAAAASAATQAINNGRNRFHNPSLIVQQRGGPWTVGGANTADRWLVGGNAPTSYSAILTATAGISGAYATTMLQLSATQTAANQYLLISQRLESYDCTDLVGQSVTVSFYASAAASAGTRTDTIALYYPNARDNFSGSTLISSQSVTIPAGGGRVSATFTNLPSSVKNGLEAALVIASSSGSATLTLVMTQAQFELGASITPFEQKAVTLQVADCMRFFRSAGGVFGGYGSAAGQSIYAYLPWGPPMRVTPAITGPALTGGSNYNSPSVAFNNASGTTIAMLSSAAGPVAAQFSVVAAADL